MATKVQHDRRYDRLPPVLGALRDEAWPTKHELGDRLKKPQCWIYNCETANRRVDVAEFTAWARACGADPHDALTRFLKAI
jgi:hypothetical protein